LFNTPCLDGGFKGPVIHAYAMSWGASGSNERPLDLMLSAAMMVLSRFLLN
jgi:hypothetical protein